MMTARLILSHPNPKLLEISNLVSEQDSKEQLKSWITDIQDTLIVSDGIGLAAPQIGIQKSIFCIRKSAFSNPEIFTQKCEKGIFTFINPTYFPLSSQTNREKESCLSVTNASYFVTRFSSIRLDYFDIDEYVEYVVDINDFDARIIQHEHDHLIGNLFISKLSSLDEQHFRKSFHKPKKEMTESEIQNARDKNKSKLRKERKKKIRK